MYKAIHIQTGEEIILLNTRWKAQIGDLRVLDRTDRLVCQGCRQPVRTHAGPVRRWYFAHKHLAECTYGQEAPALLQARALLYQRLTNEFGDTVTLEKQLGGFDLPRPVDCWVEGAKGYFAYWIVDAQIRSRDTRWQLQTVFEQAGARVIWVFLHSLLHADERDSNTVYLSTTEREFAGKTWFDRFYAPARVPVAMARREGKTLHYLDPDAETLTTLRGTQLIHEPSTYAAQRLCHPLADVLVSAKTGEFAHPGEHDQARAVQETKWCQEQVQREAQEARERFGAAAREDEIMVKEDPSQSTPTPTSRRSTVLDAELARLDLAGHVDPELICRFCGTVTRDWWMKERNSGLCRCKACKAKGITEVV